MPQRATLRSEPVREAWKRSAANTPIWQVTELSTRIVVFVADEREVQDARRRRPTPPGPATDRCVKYMANRPAKNISSLESQTMTPTDRVFGLVTETWAALGAAAVVDDTLSLWPRWVARSPVASALRVAETPRTSVVPRKGPAHATLVPPRAVSDSSGPGGLPPGRGAAWDLGDQPGSLTGRWACDH